MTNREKQLLQSAKQFDVEKDNLLFSSLLLINTGKKYNGFWGKNDYNQIKILGIVPHKVDYYVYDINGNYQCDIFELFSKDVTLQFDAEHDMNCFRITPFDGQYAFRVQVVQSTTKIELVKVE